MIEPNWENFLLYAPVVFTQNKDINGDKVWVWIDEDLPTSAWFYTQEDCQSYYIEQKLLSLIYSIKKIENR